MSNRNIKQQPTSKPSAGIQHEAANQSKTQGNSNDRDDLSRSQGFVLPSQDGGRDGGVLPCERVSRSVSRPADAGGRDHDLHSEADSGQDSAGSAERSVTASGVGVPDSGGWECVAAEFGEKGTDNEGLVAFWVKMPDPVISIREARMVAAAPEMAEMLLRLHQILGYEDVAELLIKAGVPHV